MVIYAILLVHSTHGLHQQLTLIQGYFSKILIHVDGKQAIEPYKQIVSDFECVELAEKRFNGYWGGWGIVEATIHCLKELVEKTGTEQMSHVQLLSGSCAPIKSSKMYHEFLAKNPDVDFIDAEKLPLPDLDGGGLNRTLYHFDNFGKSTFYTRAKWLQRFTYRRPFRKHLLIYTSPIAQYPPIFQLFTLPSTLLQKFYSILRFMKRPWYKKPLTNIYYGSQWWCISQASVHTVIQSYDHDLSLRQRFSESLLPDESYLQTIIGRAGTTANSLHHVDWTGSEKPNTFSMDQLFGLKNLHKNKNLFFARKMKW